MLEHETKPALTQAEFERLSPALLVSVIADGALADSLIGQNKGMTRQEFDWFVHLADWWTRFHAANNRTWKNQLKKADPRDFVAKWCAHWATAYVKNPAQYRTKQRRANEASKDPEWRDGTLNDTQHLTRPPAVVGPTTQPQAMNMPKPNDAVDRLAQDAARVLSKFGPEVGDEFDELRNSLLAAMPHLGTEARSYVGKACSSYEEAARQSLAARKPQRGKGPTR